MRRTARWAFLAVLACGVAYGAAPLFEETELFVGGQDGINTYRIPALTCTKSGTVLAFCEGRIDNSEDGSPTHLVLKRRTGNARAWNPMQIVLASRAGIAYMNPVPIIDRANGAIHLLVNYYTHYDPHTEERDAKVWLLTSRDEGAHWSKPVDLTPQVGAQELGPGIGIQLESGRFVAPTYQGVIYSDDRGAHWRAGGRAPGPSSESQVVELADGSLMRNTRGAPLRTITVSRDRGATWGEAWRDPALTDSRLWDGCQASLIRHTKNRLLFANPADLRSRFLMTVRLSYDEGKTWPVSRLIRNGTGAYSSLTVFPDGTIGLMYETGNGFDEPFDFHVKIAFARFNLEWLTDGRDRLP
ncbi:MAG: sialidase family protein [Acidobacteriota bacterium]